MLQFPPALVFAHDFQIFSSYLSPHWTAQNKPSPNLKQLKSTCTEDALDSGSGDGNVRLGHLWFVNPGVPSMSACNANGPNLLRIPSAKAASWRNGNKTVLLQGSDPPHLWVSGWTAHPYSDHSAKAGENRWEWPLAKVCMSSICSSHLESHHLTNIFCTSFSNKKWKTCRRIAFLKLLCATLCHFVPLLLYLAISCYWCSSSSMSHPHMGPPSRSLAAPCSWCFLRSTSSRLSTIS